MVLKRLKRSLLRRRKTTFRRRKRAIRRVNRINVRKYNYRFSSETPIVGDAAGIQFAAMMNYPFWEYNGSFSQTLNPPPSYLRCCDLYSEYVVKGVAVRYMPRYNQNPVGSGGSVGTSTMIVDPRQANWAGNISEAANYPMLKMFDSSRSMSVYIKNKFTRGWFRTTADPTDSVVTGTQTPPNPLGSLGFNIASVAGGNDPTTIGTILFTWYITFRGVKTGQTYEGVPQDPAPNSLAKPVLVKSSVAQPQQVSELKVAV